MINGPYRKFTIQANGRPVKCIVGSDPSFLSPPGLLDALLRLSQAQGQDSVVKVHGGDAAVSAAAATAAGDE